MKPFRLLPAALVATAFPTAAFALQSDGSAGLLTVVFLVCVYILPSVIAMARSHTNTLAIVLLNLLLGWTLLGWVVALLWSVISDSQPKAPAYGKAEPVATKSAGEKIAEIKDLMDRGVITQAEFDKMKADIVRGG